MQRLPCQVFCMYYVRARCFVCIMSLNPLNHPSCEVQIIILIIEMKQLGLEKVLELWCEAWLSSFRVQVLSHWAQCQICFKKNKKLKMRWERWAGTRWWETWTPRSAISVDWVHGISPVSLAPDHTVAEQPGNRETILTVMDLIAVLLQALDVPLLQHAVSHQQLEESPVDISHDAHSPRAALHGWRNWKKKQRQSSHVWAHQKQHSTVRSNLH